MLLLKGCLPLKSADRVLCGVLIRPTISPQAGVMVEPGSLPASPVFSALLSLPGVHPGGCSPSVFCGVRLCRAFLECVLVVWPIVGWSFGLAFKGGY